MKATSMTTSSRIRILTLVATLSLMAFCLFSCSGPSVRQSSSEMASEPPESRTSDGLHGASDHEGAALPSPSEMDGPKQWTDFSWEGIDGSEQVEMPQDKEDELDLSTPFQDPSIALQRGPGGRETSSAPGEFGIEEKYPQPLSSAKEEENSDQARLYDAIDFCQKSQELWKQGRLEKAKRCLDQAYQSILDIELSEDPEMIQQIDDLRFLIARRILEIYASRFNGVKGNHDEIPLVMNDHVRTEIKRFQGKERDFFLEAHTRSGRYRPLILGKLEEAGLPQELSWLPLIESGFKVRALSRSRALGLWQFIPSTGYKFGLQRNQWIDERMDVEKSTDAAIAYLEELHKIFGDWTTVLAAYNCGENAVLRAIRKQRINYLDDFWDLYARLPRETARYVPRYLAVLHIIREPQLYGFELNGPVSPYAYEEVEVAKPVRLKDVARAIKISEDVLVELNPELRHKATPKGYMLKVPPEKTDLLQAHLAKIPKYVPPKRQYVYHRVRRGETLSHIARKYRTSVRAIANANGIVQKDMIRTGQKLKIPVR